MDSNQAYEYFKFLCINQEQIKQYMYYWLIVQTKKKATILTGKCKGMQRSRRTRPASCIRRRLRATDGEI